MSGDEAPGLWVRSDVLPTGAYGVTINVGDDTAWTLTPDRAVRYVAACMRRTTEAEHDTAVLSFLSTELGISESNAYELIVQYLRPDRPVDHSDTEPLAFHPGVVARSRRPFLRMTLHGRSAGELTVADLEDHAMHVLKVLAAADLDAALVRCLVSTIGTDDNQARAMVEALTKHWPAPETPRSDVRPGQKK